VGFGCGWAKLNVVFLCRQVHWQNTSFNFAKRWHFYPPFLSVCCPVVGRPTLAPNLYIPSTKELLYGVYTSNIVVFTQENKNLLHIHSEL